jgi:HAE1 family hydrophobic/amphiphilic exporter-1
MGLTKTAITRPVLILMLMVAAVLLGYMSYGGMRKEQNPEVSFGVITITTPYPGASPDEVNTLVSRKVEESVSGVNGLREVTSTSQEGFSSVVANFNVGTNMDTALSDVRSKVDAIVNELPTEVLKPTVNKIDSTSSPVMYMVANSPTLTNKQLRDLADDKLVDMFGQIDGVASTSVNGGEIREIQVRLKKEKLVAYGVGIADIQRAVNAATLNVPSGHVIAGQQQYNVRVLGEFKTPEELSGMVIHIADPNSQSGGGKTIHLRDIADIVDTTAERTSYSRLNGREAVSIVIQKAREGNSIDISKAAHAVMERIKKSYGVAMTVTYDESTSISESLADLNFSLFFGIFLVASIVFLFLHNLRGTIIVSIAIPVCLMTSFIAMSIFGFTINNMSMLALSLAIGVLVDDAIVVLENIYRHLRMGEDPREAAINGRGEIGLAAIAITLADVVVFTPIAFMGGIVGQFFKPMALSFAATVVISLFVSFTVTPMLAARWYKTGEDMEHPKGRFAQGFERAFGRLEAFYRRVLEWALNHRWFVFIAGFTILISVFMMIGGSFVAPHAPMGATGADASPLKYGYLGAFMTGFGLTQMALMIGLVVIGLTYWPKVMAYHTRRWFIWGSIPAAIVLRVVLSKVAPEVASTPAPLLMPWVLYGVAAFIANLAKPRVRSRILSNALLFGLVFPIASIAGFGWAQFKQDQLFKFTFIPSTDASKVSIDIELPPDASLAATEQVVKQVEGVVMKDPDTKYVLSQVGSASGGGFGGGGAVGSNRASIAVTLFDRAAITDRFPWSHHSEKLRYRADTAVSADMLKAIGKVAGASIKVSANGSGFGQPIQMSFAGENRQLLTDTVENLVSKLRQGAIPGIINPDISSKPGVPELRIIPDRQKLAEQGLTVQDLGQAARIMYQGNNDTKFRVNGREYDIRVMLDLADRNNPAVLAQLPIAFRQGNPLFVSNVGAIQGGKGVDKIDRRDRAEEVRLTADLLPGYAAGTVQQQINGWIAKEHLVPEGVRLKPLGQADVQNREQGYLFGAMGLGFLLVYMLLASLFDNLLYPLIIQLAQPQAMVGALLALIITDKSLNIVGMIGIITLIGLVGKNAILVVDYTNTLRGRGRSRHDALVEAGPTRLRPIMMTTLALIFGIMPVALAIGRGSEFRETIGITIIGGITLSTLLTLVVIPCSYTIFDDFANYLGKLFRRNRPTIDRKDVDRERTQSDEPLPVPV